MSGCCLNRAHLATKLGGMPEELVWTESVRGDLLRAASTAAPRECAAVLGGEADGARTAITALVEVPNALSIRANQMRYVRQPLIRVWPDGDLASSHPPVHSTTSASLLSHTVSLSAGRVHDVCRVIVLW